MFFTPRYVKEARQYAEAARRVVRYRLDLLTREQVDAIEAKVAQVEAAAEARDREGVKKAVADLDRTVGRHAPPRPHPGWRENVEVILVAIIIAAGVRAYLIEPFKIPTGSMQPTLNGVIGVPSNEAAPNFLVRAFEFVVRGRTYVDVVGKDDEVVVGLREHSRLNYFTWTEVQGSRNRYTVFAPAAVVQQAFRVHPGRDIRRGQPLVRGYVDNGDFVLVNKMAYNFAAPERGDIFVFRTTGIRLIEKDIPEGLGSQHYIKRLAGEPGDTLRIAQPELFINGKLATERPFARVMSLKDGYRGYANPTFDPMTLATPRDTYTVPPRSYYALGDNSFNSFDSRYWGPVPERNVTGKGFMVFWPFSSHWGFMN